MRKWMKKVDRGPRHCRKEYMLVEMDSFRDEFSLQLIAWWADNASLVMTRIRAIEKTTETAADNTHAANADHGGMQHDQNHSAELVPQAPVQTGNVTDPIDHDEHLSHEQGQTMQKLLQEEFETYRQEMQRILQEERGSDRQQMQNVLKEERQKDRQEMQEVLRKELEGFKLQVRT